MRIHRREVAPGAAAQLTDLQLASTTLERTVADVLASGDRLQAVCCAESALRLRPPLSRDAIRGQLLGLRGAAEGRRRLASTDPLSESPLETLVRLVLSDAGLPPPVLQYRVFSDGFPIARLDLAWPLQRVGVEADGMGVHAQPDALFRDRRRQNQLVNQGWRILRFTWADATTRAPALVRAVAGALDGQRPEQRTERRTEQRTGQRTERRTERRTGDRIVARSAERSRRSAGA